MHPTPHHWPLLPTTPTVLTARTKLFSREAAKDAKKAEKNERAAARQVFLASSRETLASQVNSVENLMPVHPKQLLTYLRLLNPHLGLLINFGAATFKEGINRIANDHHAFA